jgi:hypothetical protein
MVEFGFVRILLGCIVLTKSLRGIGGDKSPSDNEPSIHDSNSVLIN